MNNIRLKTITKTLALTSWGVLGLFTVLQMFLISFAACSAIGQTVEGKASAIGNEVLKSVVANGADLQSGASNPIAPPAQSSNPIAPPAQSSNPVAPPAQSSNPPSSNPAPVNQWTDNTPMRVGFRVDAVDLRRTGLQDQAFVFNRDLTETILSYSDLDPASETAARFRLTYQSDGGTGFELGYFSFESFAGSATVTEGVPVLFGGVPSNLARSYDISDQSSLNSFELNAWERRSQRLRLGIGYRSFNFDNAFDTIQTGSRNGFFADTENQLIGGQLLAEHYSPLQGTAQVETGFRLGFYNNDVEVRYDSLNRDLQYDDDRFSTAIDWNIGVAWHLTSSLVLRAGYQGIFISNLATASAQSTDFDFFADSAPVQFSDIYFSGGYFGAEVRF